MPSRTVEGTILVAVYSLRYTECGCIEKWESVVNYTEKTRFPPATPLVPHYLIVD